MEKIQVGQDTVYLKKDILGYRVVHPIKNEDGSINWFNLLVGGKSNLVFLIILLLVATTIYFGVNELISNYKLVADNPCNFCENCFEQKRAVIANINAKNNPMPNSINWTILNVN